MKIGITSDCSSGLEYASFKHQIKITRTTIHFGSDELVDGIDIKADEFYERLWNNKDIVPTTSAPTPEEIMKRAMEWRDEGCTDVIHFPISFGLSKYGENLQCYSEDLVDGINYHVYNCKSGAMVEGWTAHYAEILANAGCTVDEVFAGCDQFLAQSCTYLMVDDLKYLVKNGRLNAASGMIGSLMKIKPILILGAESEGKINTFEKVRTRGKAIDRMIEIVKEKTKNAKEIIITVQHSRSFDEAQALVERLKNEYSNCVRFTLNTVTPTVGAHIGCGVMAISYIILDGLKEKDELIK